MRILMVARFGPHDNQDEDAIAYALEQLGHTVLQIHEEIASPGILAECEQDHDFLLYLKWEKLDILKGVNIPKVGWYFDMIESDDWDLKHRSQVRAQWVREVTPITDLLFMTDGDCVSRDTSGKLRWLMQGMDERVIGLGKSPYGGLGTPNGVCDVLFTGSTIHGGKRISHIEELKAYYGSRFVAFGHRPRDRRHGRELADIYASAKVVIAPDGPVTDRYWSNRIYLTLGLGGFLLHPYCEGLRAHYTEDELPMYKSRSHCLDLINTYLFLPEDRERISKAGYERTVKEHLYRHRCAQLITEVEKRL